MPWVLLFTPFCLHKDDVTSSFLTPIHVTLHLTEYDVIIFFTSSHVTLCKQRCEWESCLNTYTSQDEKVPPETIPLTDLVSLSNSRLLFILTCVLPLREGEKMQCFFFILFFINIFTIINPYTIHDVTIYHRHISFCSDSIASAKM